MWPSASWVLGITIQLLSSMWAWNCIFFIDVILNSFPMANILNMPLQAAYTKFHANISIHGWLTVTSWNSIGGRVHSWNVVPSCNTKHEASTVRSYLFVKFYVNLTHIFHEDSGIWIFAELCIHARKISFCLIIWTHKRDPEKAHLCLNSYARWKNLCACKLN